MTKLFNSDEQSINGEFIRSNVTMCDDREFGADPYEILAALEEQYGLPMAMKQQPAPLTIKSAHPGRITGHRAEIKRLATVYKLLDQCVNAQPLISKIEPTKIVRVSLEAIELARIQRMMDAPALTNNFTTEHIVHVPTNLAALPAPIQAKQMTYDEAYEEATIGCWELMGSPDSTGSDWDNLHDKLLDALCIKHDIKESKPEPKYMGFTDGAIASYDMIMHSSTLADAIRNAASCFPGMPAETVAHMYDKTATVTFSNHGNTIDVE